MMVPLPVALDPSAALVGWRIDAQRYATTWDSGLGAERFGGRWNPKGVRAVYCCLDPATCLVEAAVHRGFKVLDSQPHMLSGFEVTDSSRLLVVMPNDVPNPAWLQSGIPSRNQQVWGAELLLKNGFVLFPSAVSKFSWNLVFAPTAVNGKYALRLQERLVVDTRFHPVA